VRDLLFGPARPEPWDVNTAVANFKFAIAFLPGGRLVLSTVEGLVLPAPALPGSEVEGLGLSTREGLAF